MTFDLLAPWRTNHRVTVYLFEHLPDEVWPLKVPEMPRKTVRMIAGHLHNTRCMWLKMTGDGHDVAVPESVERRGVTREELLPALAGSYEAVRRLLELAVENGGEVPGMKGIPHRARCNPCRSFTFRPNTFSSNPARSFAVSSSSDTS